MAIAALYDIHGNLPALEAVLSEIETEAVGEIVVGGDVFPGPLSSSCLERLLELEIPTHFIMGNGDRETLALASGHVPETIPEAYVPAMSWVAKQLDKTSRALVASWPATLYRDSRKHGKLHFCHATPDNDNRIVTVRTPSEQISEFFAGSHADVVLCGHTHMPFDRTVGRIRVVNPGSVGMPFGEPGAYWLLIDADIELRRTEYDYQVAASIIRDTAYPLAENFAQNNILSPPSAALMLDLFSKPKPG